MGTKGAETRQRILDTAQSLILEHGYSGVSVDRIINGLGLTKGAFFHHFRSKKDLAHDLIQRFADDGNALLSKSIARARKLSDDPLQQFLIVVGLYEEIFEGLSEPYSGCLLASYVYELQEFDDDVRPIINSEFLFARSELTALLTRVAERYPPRMKVDLRALADTFMSTFEGAFILSKSLSEPDITIEQLRLYRSFVQLLFRPGESGP